MRKYEGLWILVNAFRMLNPGIDRETVTGRIEKNGKATKTVKRWSRDPVKGYGHWDTTIKGTVYNFVLYVDNKEVFRQVVTEGVDINGINDLGEITNILVKLTKESNDN